MQLIKEDPGKKLLWPFPFLSYPSFCVLWWIFSAFVFTNAVHQERILEKACLCACMRRHEQKNKL